jgi:ribosomal protein S18 acetylase RimI-like enzyme
MNSGSIKLSGDKTLQSEIRRIGRTCFPSVYWSSIDTVINEYCPKHSIFAFSEEDTLQGFILIRSDGLVDASGLTVAPHHIEYLAVDPACAGKGIGGLMMKAALLSYNITQQDKWLTCPYLLWLHVDTDNYIARRLYEKMGFRIWCSAADDFGYNGYIMVK